MGQVQEALNESLPTKQELDEHIQANIDSKIQEQTHGSTCDKCVRAVNQTPNPKAILRYCKWNGVMVSKHATSCGKFHGKV